MRYLILDIETDALLEELTKVHCAVVMDAETKQRQLYYDGPIKHPLHAGSLRDLLDRLKGSVDEVWCGHNINQFDFPALKKVYPTEDFDHLPRWDTLVVGRVQYFNLGERDIRSKNGSLIQRGLVGSHSLEAWGFRLGVHKQASPDFSTLTPEMLDYCAADALVTCSLLLKQRAEIGDPKWVSLEQDFARCVDSIVSAGVEFDVKAAHELRKKLLVDRAEAELSLRDHSEFTDFEDEYVTPKKKIKKTRKVIFNATSRRHIERVLLERLGFKAKVRTHPTGKAAPMAKDKTAMRKWLRECSVEAPKGADPLRLLDLTDTGHVKVTEDSLDAIVDTVPAASALSRLLLIQRRLGQLNGLLAVASDGRIYGQIGHAGTVTGRCNHYRPNMTQYPAIDKPYGPEFRALFKAPVGMKMVGADAKGLELRGLAHYLAAYDGGAYARTCVEADPHTANQKAANLETRAQAKTFIYAMLYGAGAEKLGKIVGKDAAAGQRLREAWINNTEGVSSFFESIRETLVRRKCAEYRPTWGGGQKLVLLPNAYLRGIDGRPLYIRSLHSAANTAIQSWGAVVVKQVTVLVFRQAAARGWVVGRDWNMVLHVHDEFQCEVKDEIANEFQQMVLGCFGESGKILGCRVRIDGDAKVGSSWAETH